MITHKGYIVKPAPASPSSYVIVTEGRGGKIPAIMEGVFTSPAWAKEVIDRYVGSKETTDDQKINKRGV